MWYRHSNNRIQNLATGLEIRVQADGNDWSVVAESPVTTPNVTMLGTGFSSEQTANEAYLTFLQDNSIPFGALLISPSRGEG